MKKTLKEQSSSSKSYKKLVQKIDAVIQKYRIEASITIHQILVKMYWEIGRYIVVYFQENEPRAAYNEEVIHHLSSDLTTLAKGFSVANLKSMRLFYLTYIDSHMLRPGITWSHYQRLMRLDCNNTRRFYEEMIVREKWSVRVLEKQIENCLYQRTTVSDEREEQVVKKAERPLLPTPNIENSLKDPYILDFLDLEEGKYKESDLENAIISNIEKFLLELRYGFTFAWRQKRIQIGNQFFYVDLVFYHRGLRCLVLIDLKIGSFTHTDAGQMNMYLNYFRKNERYEFEKDPIGIILCADREKEVVEYALGNIKQRIFVSKYQTMLPSQDLLKQRMVEEKRRYYHRTQMENRTIDSKHPRKDRIIECTKEYSRLTVGEYCQIANVSRSTAQRDLARAVAEGWLGRHGKGRSCHYVLIPPKEV